MAPDLERSPEPVDVLRASDLVHPRLFGRGQVALDVLVGEPALLGGRVVLVGAKVKVVVGQHGPPR
jgi:hypothetical protein